MADEKDVVESADVFSPEAIEALRRQSLGIDRKLAMARFRFQRAEAALREAEADRAGAEKFLAWLEAEALDDDTAPRS